MFLTSIRKLHINQLMQNCQLFLGLISVKASTYYLYVSHSLSVINTKSLNMIQHESLNFLGYRNSPSSQRALIYAANNGNSNIHSLSPTYTFWTGGHTAVFPGVPSPFVDIAPRSGILIWVSERVRVLSIIKLLSMVSCRPSNSLNPALQWRCALNHQKLLEFLF